MKRTVALLMAIAIVFCVIFTGCGNAETPDGEGGGESTLKAACILGVGGLGGAYLSVVQSNLFVKEMVAGRGYMALAATIFGGWNPVGSLLASLLFAFAQALRIQVDFELPERILQMLPYLLTLAVLIGFGRRVQGPQAAGDIKD